MKVIGLNDKEYTLNLLKHKDNSERTNKSKIHILARTLLKNCYPAYTIYEEVKLSGSTNPKNKSVLFLDFLIPNLMIGVEVHGKQHFEYTPFYHKTKLGYYQHLYRDNLKAEWCEKNGIQLIHLKYNEIDLWRMQIERCR
jgi:hypothetical protein